MVLILAMPFAVAQETTDESTVIQGGQEYPLMQRAMDRIRLAFTWQAESKLELMNKIQEKRQAQYRFLVAKGKTDQAERFKQGTTGLEKNFEQWKGKAGKQETIQKMEQKKIQQQIENQGAEAQIREQERLRNISLHEEQPVAQPIAQGNKK